MCERGAPPLTSDTMRVNMSGPNYTCVECHTPDMMAIPHVHTVCSEATGLCKYLTRVSHLMLDL